MRHYLELYIEEDFTTELLSVFPSLPWLMFWFRFRFQIPDFGFRIPDSGFWILDSGFPDFPYASLSQPKRKYVLYNKNII